MKERWNCPLSLKKRLSPSLLISKPLHSKM
uniref:Uncharacterized protein n=1 Tax=Anguilla anguilla TaxID=7936 RepID=A0A0E9RU24_ANGAN